MERKYKKIAIGKFEMTFLFWDSEIDINIFIFPKVTEYRKYFCFQWLKMALVINDKKYNFFK